MSLDSKEVWYDWGGANEWLFKQVNGIRAGEFYDNAMITLSNIADHHNFPYYMAGLVIFAALSYVIRKVTNRGGSPHMLAAWLGVLLVLGGGYAVEGYIIHHSKDYFSYPRPYMVLAQDTRVLETRPSDDSYHSFPSGHTAFITLMVFGLWPVLTPTLQSLGAILIAGVMWSRLVLGVHFPADVILSFLFFSALVLTIRKAIYWVLRDAFGMKC